MQNSEHVMLVGRGAEDFAENKVLVGWPSYFYTEKMEIPCSKALREEHGPFYLKPIGKEKRELSVV